MSRHLVAAAVVDGANPFELSVACEVFGLVRPEFGVEWYDFALCVPDGKVRLSGGLALDTGHGLDTLAAADTIIVPHGAPHGQADPRVVAAVRAAHERGARLVSFCSGAFTLAEAGVLNGRRATTHWLFVDLFRRRFPQVRLDPNVLFVDEGQVFTSAGSAAGIDLSLHLVRQDYGAKVARMLAKRLVVPPHRDGGQAQFIDPAHEPRVDGGELAALLDWLQEQLHRDVTVAEMAAQVAMSPRTFARRFREQTGTTPFRWVRGQRLQRAQELLEASTLDIEQVARRTGFGTAANLREHFRREFDTTPSDYRRAFKDRRPAA